MSTDVTVAELKFVTGLRGYHVYRTNWKPYLKEPITFKQDRNNGHDRFAVAGRTNLPGTLFPSTVGHIPLEFSRYIWYALERGASVKAEVKSVKYKPSPLVQGGLEIPIEVTVKWEDKRALQILEEKVESVRYPLADEESYIDDSKEILKSILDDAQIVESGRDSADDDDSAYSHDEQIDFDGEVMEVSFNSVDSESDSEGDVQIIEPGRE